MKRPNPHPTNDSLDAMIDQHLAGTTDQLQPSSGFVLSVMDSVQAQAAEPPPIAFPWTRALPGLIAILFSLALLVVLVFRAGVGSSVATLPARPGGQFLASLSHTLASSEATWSWIGVAVFLSIAAIAASFRLVGRSG